MKQVWGITMMKDEQDVAKEVLEHLVVEGVSGIIVADNGSTDATRVRLKELKASAKISIHIVDDAEPAYYQSRKMTQLAARAAELGATWIIPFDADELWCGAKAPFAELLLNDVAHDVQVVGLPTYRYIESSLDDWGEANPFLRIRHRFPNPAAQYKVAYRYHSSIEIRMGNHGVLCEGKVLAPKVYDPATSYASIRHFPYRSYDQFVRKMHNGGAAYAACPPNTMSKDTGRHWKGFGNMLATYGEPAMRVHYFTKLYQSEPWATRMVEDPAPWCRQKR